MRFIRDNLVRLVFAFGILVGVQLPNAVTQYEHRVAAHLSEVTLNFVGFQKIADQYFDGSVERLILHHQQSSDRVFVAEAEPIRKLWLRLQHLQAEQAALAGGLASKVWHLATAADADIRTETVSGYVATVPLTLDAIFCGLLAGFALGALVELLFAALARLTTTRPRGRA